MERRNLSRGPIELSVEYKRLNTFFSDYTRNISKGGTFIRTTRPLDIGTAFEFALSIPNLEEPLRLRGIVKWVTREDQAGQDSPPGMGIEFQYDSPEERRTSELVVERLMVRELGESLSAKLLKRRPGVP